MVTTINERTTTATADLDVDPVELGSQSSASGANATAIGVNTNALADGSVAIGEDTSINVQDAASIGSRDLYLTDGYNILYPEDQGVQTLVNNPATSSAPQGEEHSILFKIADGEAMRVFGEADGAGGVQNLSVKLPGDLDVSSGEATVDQLIAEGTTIEDSNGNKRVALEGDTAKVAVNMYGNEIKDLNKITATGGELLVDGDITISGELTENSAL